ncbi:MAG: ribonuclease HI family protein [Candidatus Sungbacteria bacterium]|uniref:Ribonuclease HI family protein n=1 Tax=Candidatus Sungiibacteriota bacterium TaxID=2750080 RepID=A0A9D6LRI4_9BACT|nr:ribonuclease HI family protein [Candidatus Sungbacteria bacterium]
MPKIKDLISDKLIVYTDGGSRGNPGPAALGVYITDAKANHVKSYGETLGVKTNNEAEYAAVIFALKKIKALVGKEKTKQLSIDIRADSELLVRQLNHQYKIESDQVIPLFIQLWNLMLDYKLVTFTHVFREKNRQADRLVNQALDQIKGSLF